MPTLSAVLLTFSFQFILLSLTYRSLGRNRAISMALGRTSTAATIGQYGTTDAAENLRKSLSGAQRTAQGKDFELILT